MKSKSMALQKLKERYAKEAADEPSKKKSGISIEILSGDPVEHQEAEMEKEESPEHLKEIKEGQEAKLDEDKAPEDPSWQGLDMKALAAKAMGLNKRKPSRVFKAGRMG